MNETPPRFPRVVVEVDAPDSDVLSATLFELGATGVEERDQATLLKSSADGRVTLVASFDSFEEAHEAVASLSDMGARIEEIVGDAWRDSWKEGFHPFHLTPSVVICPPWEEWTAAPGERVLVLEPGRAFGTGLHATTSLVARALERHLDELSGREILDVGCGTGILAIVALACGATRARAVDNDPDVIDVVRENAARNGMVPRIDADTTDASELRGAWPVVVANIEARVLLPMAPHLTRLLTQGGLLVLSGVLEDQRDEVVEAYAGLRLEKVEQQDEWIALELRRV
ncbi:MAG TPA: 50S ribosomal protein L11 methyltransferase [Polyangiaceae bacterium]|nr:50S ribosomal protein L11 methyltransferase [Polyangiaceae bacterium]